MGAKTVEIRDATPGWTLVQGAAGGLHACARARSGAMAELGDLLKEQLRAWTFSLAIAFLGAAAAVDFLREKNGNLHLSKMRNKNI